MMSILNMFHKENTASSVIGSRARRVGMDDGIDKSYEGKNVWKEAQDVEKQRPMEDKSGTEEGFMLAIPTMDINKCIDDQRSDFKRRHAKGRRARNIKAL